LVDKPQDMWCLLFKSSSGIVQDEGRYIQQNRNESCCKGRLKTPGLLEVLA